MHFFDDFRCKFNLNAKLFSEFITERTCLPDAEDVYSVMCDFRIKFEIID